MSPIPNPAGSATEKWQPTRWGVDSRTERLRQLLLSEGVEEGLALGFSLAMRELMQVRTYERRELLEEFSRWANAHTHPGFNGPVIDDYTFLLDARDITPQADDTPLGSFTWVDRIDSVNFAGNNFDYRDGSVGGPPQGEAYLERTNSAANAYVNTPDLGTSVTFFAVHKPSAPGGGSITIWYLLTNGDSGSGSGHVDPSLGILRASNKYCVNGQDTGIAANTGAWEVIIGRQVGLDWSFKLNDNPIVSGTKGGSADSMLGFCVGDISTATSNINVTRAGLYDRALSDEEMDTLAAELMTMYGIS